MRTFTLIITIIFSYQIRLASQSNRIEGQIIDSVTQTPIPFAIVKIESEKNKQTLLTDDNGRFRFKNLSATEGYIQVKAIGYKATDTTFNFSIQLNKPINFLIKLEQEIKNLSEVVISGSRIIQKVDKMIYQFNDKEVKSANNALELLSSAPLLSVNTEGGILIKGKSGVPIFVDGKPILDDRILKSLPTDLISKVEIITNPGAQYDTKTMAGIVNIITKSGWLGRYGNLSSQIGTNNTHNGFLFFSSKSKKVDINLTMGVNTYDRPFNSETQRLFNNQTLYQSLIGQNKSFQPSISTGITYKVDSTNQFNIYSNLYAPMFRNTNTGNFFKPSLINDIADLDFSQENHIKTDNFLIKNYFDFTHEKKASRLILSFLMYNNILKNDNELLKKNADSNLSRQINASNLDEYSFQIDFSKTKSKNYSYILGSKFILRHNFSDYNLYNFDKSKQLLLLDTSSIFNNTFNVSQNVYSIYFNNNLKLSNKLQSSFGVRFEYDKTSFSAMNNNLFILPNLTVKYLLDENRNLKLDYRKKIYRPGITYLNPFLDISDPRTNRMGNTFLLPEALETVELSYDNSIKNHFISFSFIYNYNKNAIRSFYELLNTDRLVNKQVNLETNTNIGSSVYYKLSVKKNFTFSTNIRVDHSKLYFQYMSNSNILFNINSTVAYSTPKRFTARLTFNYNSSPLLIQGEDASISGIQVAFGKRFNERWSVSTRATDFLKMNSVRNAYVHTNLFQQKDYRDLSLNVYSISAVYSFGKRKYLYDTDVKLDNTDLKN